MGDLIQDLRYAIRLLTKQPGFTVITVFVLALGIGATTAIFSVVDAVLLKPLPYANAGRIVAVNNLWRRTGLRGQPSAPDYEDWRRQVQSFEALAIYVSGEGSVSVDAAADYAVVARVSPEFFPVMGARAELGRLQSRDEQQPGGPLTAVVSHAFWISHLGGDRSALGRTVKFRENAYTIVGVLPPEFRFPGRTDVWTAWWTVPATTSRSAHNYRVVGLLKPGVSVPQAQAEMDGIAGQLEKAYPQSNDGKGIAVDDLRDQLVRNVRTTLNLILGVVLVVLLIACANVSNLLLARATTRIRELGIRAAVGASRSRMVRQLVTESVLLALVAGAAGVLIAGWGIRGLVAIAPAGLPRLDEIRIDTRVLAFAAGISLITSFVFGLVPAWQASRVDLNEVLKQGGRSPSGGGTFKWRAALIVIETAAAVVLVIGAALLSRSFAALNRVEMGFPTDHLLVADTSVPAANADGARRAVRFYRDLLPGLAAIPGVRSVGAATAIPSVVRSNGGYVIEGGRTFEQMGINSPQALFTLASAGYFRTMEIPITRGRAFSDADEEAAPFVAVVNESLARRAFGDADPIGRRIATGYDGAKGPDGTMFMTIVGVVRDVRANDPSLAPTPQIYMPYTQHPGPATALTIVVRTDGDPRQFSTAVLQKVRAASPDVPARITTMDEVLGTAVATPRFRTILLGLFAAVALVLAMAGVYGIVSFTVSQRTSEIGLRMALGAQRAEMIRMTLGSGVKLTAIGVAAGWVAALALTRVLASMLFQVPERDPIVFGVAPAILLAVACLASIAPAVRASRVDPSVALRVE
jgi:predicted permease